MGGEDPASPVAAGQLGVKAGTRVRLVGGFDAAFVEELRERGVVEATRDAEIVFYAAARREELARREGARGARLWVIYPKGTAEIREVEVIEAGRAAGLKDVKVARFSETHTGLKFVSPARKPRSDVRDDVDLDERVAGYPRGGDRRPNRRLGTERAHEDLVHLRIILRPWPGRRWPSDTFPWMTRPPRGASSGLPGRSSCGP